MESGIIKIDVDQIKEEDLRKAWEEAEHLQWKGPHPPLYRVYVRPVRIERYNFAVELRKGARNKTHRGFRKNP